MEQVRCKISGELYPVEYTVKGSGLHPQVLQEIRQDFSDFSVGDYISYNLLMIYVDRALIRLDRAPAKVASQSGIPGPAALDTPDSFGERLADRIADFGGSWTFIIIFVSILIVWMVVNAFWFRNKGFDPYPFILLNLVLSCLAALQAPVIMMSQNRQEDRDRERAQQDYQVNLRSEAEIRMLTQKIDLLLEQQKTPT